MAASIVIVILVFLIFGSSSIVESVMKMRRMKKGDDIIKGSAVHRTAGHGEQTM